MNIPGHAIIEGIGDRGGTGDLHGHTGGLDGLQFALDLAEVDEHIVFHALEGHNGEGRCAVLIGQHGRATVEVAGNARDRIGMVRLERIELGADILLHRRGRGRSRLVAVDQHDDVSVGIAAELLLLQLRSAGGLRVGIVPTLLAHAVAQLQPKNGIESHHGRDDHQGDQSAEPVCGIAPTHEHCGVLLRVRLGWAVV